MDFFIMTDLQLQPQQKMENGLLQVCSKRHTD